MTGEHLVGITRIERSAIDALRIDGLQASIDAAGDELLVEPRTWFRRTSDERTVAAGQVVLD
jgi:hypothetical protein